MSDNVIDRAAFRDSMARLGAAVNIVTTDGEAGQYGLTVSAVCSVTDDPPTLLVCINRTSLSNAVLKANRVLCVNVLAGRHADLSARFATSACPIVERFCDAWQWTRLKTGSPVLEDAPVALDCNIVSVSEVGTHSLFLCQVVDVRFADEAGALIWFNRAYHPLSGAEVAA
jgi:flavin reductase